MPRSDDRGATGVEYAVMLAAIAAVIILVAFQIGQELLPGFQSVVTDLANLN